HHSQHSPFPTAIPSATTAGLFLRLSAQAQHTHTHTRTYAQARVARVLAWPKGRGGRQSKSLDAGFRNLESATSDPNTRNFFLCISSPSTTAHPQCPTQTICPPVPLQHPLRGHLGLSCP